MLLFPAIAKADEPQQSAKSFLENIYARYTPGQASLEPQGADADWLFDDSLLALIREDQAHAQAANEVPLLDGDPICDCQQYKSLKHVQINVQSADDDEATASVIFVNGKENTSLQYELVATNASWKIHDITGSSYGSLRDSLARQLTEEQP